MFIFINSLKIIKILNLLFQYLYHLLKIYYYYLILKLHLIHFIFIIILEFKIKIYYFFIMNQYLIYFTFIIITISIIFPIYLLNEIFNVFTFY